MRRCVKTTLALLVLTFTVSALLGQEKSEDEEKGKFSLILQVRPRAEFRNGAFTLKSQNDDPAFFVSQRSRLTTSYTREKLSVGLAVQNVRVWGSSPQIAISDGGGTMMNEAWLAYQLTDDFSFRAGRQALVYDDERILGGLDWHQAGRWHDLLLAKYEPQDWKFHLGLGYNQDAENILNNFYTAPGNNYKSLQMLWVGHNLSEQYKFSLLFLNTGFQQVAGSGQNFMYTLGGNFYRTADPLEFTTTFYYQGGENIAGHEVSAFLASIYGSYKMADQVSLLLGTDYLTGDDYYASGANQTGETESFNPLYGTHHKFYGYMDYFYVTSPHQNVGLWDKYAGVGWTASKKANFQLMSHLFNSAGTIGAAMSDEASNYLGTELDLTFGVIISPAFKINGGYSQMFATESMEILKGGDRGQFHNWVWLMLNVRPELFNSD